MDKSVLSHHWRISPMSVCSIYVTAEESFPLFRMVISSACSTAQWSFPQRSTRSPSRTKPHIRSDRHGRVSQILLWLMTTLLYAVFHNANLYGYRRQKPSPPLPPLSSSSSLPQPPSLHCLKYYSLSFLTFAPIKQYFVAVITIIIVSYIKVKFHNHHRFSLQQKLTFCIKLHELICLKPFASLSFSYNQIYNKICGFWNHTLTYKLYELVVLRLYCK